MLAPDLATHNPAQTPRRVVVPLSKEEVGAFLESMRNTAMRVLLTHGSSEELAAFLRSLETDPVAIPTEQPPDPNDSWNAERHYWTEVLGEDPAWVDAWGTYRRCPRRRS